MTSHVAAERTALAELLSELGPDAPTLCAGWATYDLAAHLAARDRVPAMLPGLVVGRLAGRTERIQSDFKSAHSYQQCVAMVRDGAPRWLPMGAPVVREKANLLEYLVHHEDVRRAQPGWVPRAVPTELADAVWGMLRLVARPAFRQVLDGVVLERPGGRGERVVAKRGRLTVTIAGDPVELALYAFNRRSVARVDVRGDDAAVARLANARIGL